MTVKRNTRWYNLIVQVLAAFPLPHGDDPNDVHCISFSKDILADFEVEVEERRVSSLTLHLKMAENAVQTEQEQPKAADSLLDMVTKQVGKDAFAYLFRVWWKIHVVLNFASSSLVPHRDLGWQLSIPFVQPIPFSCLICHSLAAGFLSRSV